MKSSIALHCIFFTCLVQTGLSDERSHAGSPDDPADVSLEDRVIASVGTLADVRDKTANASFFARFESETRDGGKSKGILRGYVFRTSDPKRKIAHSIRLFRSARMPLNKLEERIAFDGDVFARSGVPIGPFSGDGIPLPLKVNSRKLKPQDFYRSEGCAFPDMNPVDDAIFPNFAFSNEFPGKGRLIETTFLKISQLESVTKSKTSPFDLTATWKGEVRNGIQTYTRTKHSSKFDDVMNSIRFYQPEFPQWIAESNLGWEKKGKRIVLSRMDAFSTSPVPEEPTRQYHLHIEFDFVFDDELAKKLEKNEPELWLKTTTDFWEKRLADVDYELITANIPPVTPDFSKERLGKGKHAR